MNAPSFAVLPKKVITQSRTTTIVAAAAAAFAAGNSLAAFSLVIYPKAAVESPQSIYPAQMNTLRLPTLSESAPMRSVVTVAATADHATIRAM